MKLYEKYKLLYEKNYMYREEILKDFFLNKISLKKMIKLSGGTEKIATKKELTNFLKHKFTISIKADELNTSPEQLIIKIKEILKVL